MASKTEATPAIVWKTSRFQGKSFLITGKPEPLILDKATEIIQQERAHLVSEVTEGLDFLVVTRGGTAQADKKKALKFNANGSGSIRILLELDFFDLFAPDRDLAIALLKGGADGLARWQLLRSAGGVLDLGGADLRGASMPGAFLNNVILDGADLREADLGNTRLERLIDVRLDGARLVSALLPSLVSCSLRGADLSQVFLYYPGTIERCDFTGAKLVKMSARDAITSSVVFHQADLRQSLWSGAKLQDADFHAADLGEARLDKSDLTGARLNGVKLEKADLTKAILARADLTGADLRGATLLDADLSHAVIDGANFEGANLMGVKLIGVDPGKAKGLDLSPTAGVGSSNPNLRELDKVARAAQRLHTTAQLALPDGSSVTLRVQTMCSGQWVHADGFSSSLAVNYRPSLMTLEAAMLDLHRRWPEGTLQPDTVLVGAISSPVTGKALKALALAAWCEACGLPAPTAGQIKDKEKAARARKKQVREQLLGDLRGGAEGVKRWNEREQQELLEVEHFHEVDLSGAHLDGIRLKRLDFKGANFAGASLQRASLWESDFREANFHNADCREAGLESAALQGADFAGANLVQAVMRYARCRQANFKDTDLTGTDLSGVDFSAANLSQVKFDGARFDDATVFPAGFQVPEAMQWVGKGPDPRHPAAVASAGTPVPGLGLEGFLKRLQGHIDPVRLDNALRMLKAERFSLFSQVDKDNVVGVVKSQSNASLVYSCRLASDGSFSCCTQNLNVCGGLRGAVCKHLLVLILGLTKGGQMDLATVDQWVQASRNKRPALDRDAASAVFLRYKGAEAGEIDWRPTETIPEDFYTF